MSRRFRPQLLDLSNSPAVLRGERRSVPLTIMRGWKELTDGGRLRHVRIHSNYDDGSGLFITVHRFWLWTNMSRDGYDRPGMVFGPHLFADGMQWSRSKDRPPVAALDPMEVMKIRSKARREGTQMEHWDYLTFEPIDPKRGVDGPLPPAEKTQRIMRHTGVGNRRSSYRW